LFVHKHLITLMFLVGLGAGCDDAAAPKAETDGGVVVDLGGDFGGPGGDAGRLDSGPGPDADLPVGTAAFIELSLAPRQALYARTEHPQATAVVYDRVGEVLPRVAVRFDVQPAGRATVDAEGRVTFLTEGAGAVRGCVGLVCGRATFYVDDAPPPLDLESPLPGAVVLGLPAVIPVVGHADATAKVFVNDVPVPVDANGRFATEVPAVFGYNRVDVVADDGVRRPPSRTTLDVLHAPEAIAVGGGDLSLALLDTGVPPPAPDEAGVTRTDHLAGLVTALLGRLEPMGLVADPQIASGDAFNLRIEGVTLGASEVALLFTAEGIEVFVRLNDLAVQTSGLLDLEDVAIGLDGAVRITASAFAQVRIEPGPDGYPGLRLAGADVALERVSGQFADSTAQAVMDTLGSILRAAVEGFARDLVTDIVAEQVPEFIELGLASALAPLSAVPLDVEADPPVPAIALDVGFALDPSELRPNGGLVLGLTGSVRQRNQVVVPHPSPGVLRETYVETPPWPAQGSLAVAVQLAVINGLLHAVWAQGALQIDASAIVPDALRAVVREARIDARLPPVVVAAPPGSPYFFELQLGELDLFLRGARETPEPDHYVISLRAGLSLQVGAPPGSPADHPDAGQVRLNVLDDPDLRVVLRAAGGERATFDADALAALLESVLWPEVRDAVGAGLGLGLDAIQVDLAAVQAIAPSVRGVEIRPGFPAGPAVRQGWFVLPAHVDLALQ
jgi:hypothetical protein